MEFDKSKVYTQLNADELRPGDRIICADTLSYLKRKISSDDYYVSTIKEILDETKHKRFKTTSDISWVLAYLVERKENCTNCNLMFTMSCPGKDKWELLTKNNRCSNYMGKGVVATEMISPVTSGNTEEQENCKDKKELKLINIVVCDDRFEVIARAKKHIIKVTNIEQSPDEMKVLDSFLFRCWQIGWLDRFSEVKTPELISLGNGQYEKKRYRPFDDTGELIQAWLDKGGKWQKRDLTMPLIWVRDKHREHDECLIVRYDRVNNKIHIAGFGEFSLDSLFECFEFLDGSPCGVEEA